MAKSKKLVYISLSAVSFFILILLIFQSNNYVVETEKSMNLDEFFQYLIDNKVPPTAIEELVDTFIATQNPPTTIDDLRNIYNAKVDSIATYQCQFVGIRVSGNTESFIKSSYVFDGDKLRKELYTGDCIDTLQFKHRHGYDGMYWRMMGIDDDGEKRGSIQKEQYRRGGVFNADLPLKGAMLLRTPDQRSAHLQYDIFNFFDNEGYSFPAFVMEQPVIVNGYKCLVVTNIDFSIYLAPELGYAFVRFESNIHEVDETSGHLIGGRKSHIRECSDFVDYSNGLFLPNTIKESWIDENGEVWQTNELKVVSREVNQSIPHELFVDIIDEGSLVSDYSAFEK